ncbi:MAG: hypothetical protein R3E32_12215 [Chitinophagales bacterium]
MINLKNLKSLFIVEDEEGQGSKTPVEEKKDEPKQEVNQETTKKPEEDSKTSPQNNKQKVSDMPPPPTPKKPVVSEKYYTMLMKAIEMNNLEGFDYLEFKHSLTALKNIPIDEPTKFQTAFATASTMGLTKQKLVESADFYKKVLEKEKDSFRNELQKHIGERLHKNEARTTDLAQMIQQKSEQIKKLTQEISQNQAELDKTRQQIEELKEKVQEERDSFVGTYDHLFAQMDKDVENINKYLD